MWDATSDDCVWYYLLLGYVPSLTKILVSLQYTLSLVINDSHLTVNEFLINFKHYYYRKTLLLVSRSFACQIQFIPNVSIYIDVSARLNHTITIKGGA